MDMGAGLGARRSCAGPKRTLHALGSSAGVLPPPIRPDVRYDWTNPFVFSVS